jgi:hypothetical protein
MKTVFFSSILVVLIFEACNSLSTDNSIKKFIPGTYIRFSQHEFGSEWDTLTISLQNEIANEYNVLRKWRYVRILDGKPIAPDYKKQNAIAVYDKGAKQLKTLETGDSYSFDYKQNLLFAGTTKYQKIK